MEEINKLLEKYDHFKYAQIHSVVGPSETQKTLTIMVQDDDGIDTDKITIDFQGVQKFRILDGTVLSFLDMSFGVSIIKEKELYGFALGRDTSMLHVMNAPLFIIASEIAISEERVA